jgi:ParB family transcriptional regulator, chromosome partitioning protein
MEVVDLPLAQLQEAPWNPNQMDEAMLHRLRESLSRYGLVENLVVRPLRKDTYEVLSGNQRLQVLRELGTEAAPCVVVHLNDTQARLLSQALNRIQGEDDLGLRAELLRKVLKVMPQQEVLNLLPETTESLRAMASLGQDTMAEYLQSWQQAQPARLKHLTFQLTSAQWEVVEEALSRLLPLARQAPTDSPNARGTALYLLCLGYLEREGRPA